MIIDANSRTVIFGKEAREKLILGANILADAVKSTLGARGRTVIIDKNNPKAGRLSGIIATKDGVTVANEINLPDRQMNTGAQLLKKAANETVKSAGDGTTTATVLAQIILNEGDKKIAAGLNAVELKKGMDYAVNKIKVLLTSYKKDIISRTDLFNIALVSSNGDNEIAELVTDAIWKIGKDGMVSIQESENRYTSIDTVKGLKYDCGWISKYFVTNSDTMLWEANKPAVVLSEETITSYVQIESLVKHFLGLKIPLLIIAKDFDESVVRYAVDVKTRGFGEICLVKASGFGDMRRARFLDISIFTSADVFQNNKAFNLGDLDSFKKAGTCGKVIVSGDTLVMTESITDLMPESVDKTKLLTKFVEYTNKLKQDIDKEEDAYEKTKLKERYANLIGGTAVIKVGGSNEVEMKEKKDRIDDAVNAAKCAMEQGYVSGGGTAYLNAFREMTSFRPEELNDEQYQGYKLVREALQEPIKTILNNGGINPNDVIPKIINQEYAGYDIRKLDFVFDMVEAGIIDPLKVVITALEKAVSVASIMLTTNCLINYYDETIYNK